MPTVEAVAEILADVIATVREVPSGFLYAALEGKLDMETYLDSLSMLEKAGMISISPEYLITWKDN